VVNQLGLRIIRGDYQPGAILDTEQLESEFGVSKTVVRETLRVMGAKGLVDSRPKRGTFVREREAWNLLDSDVMLWRRLAHRDDDMLLADLSELRNFIEPATARLAALRRTDDDLDRLEQAISDLGAAGRDTERLVKADLDFHVLLQQASHNELLVRMDFIVIHAVGARDRILHQAGKKWRDPVPDHLGVLEAVRGGDGDEAYRAMVYLLRESNDDLLAGEPPFVS
jgi:DNA-binding FadR family transcriptional regulator